MNKKHEARSHFYIFCINNKINSKLFFKNDCIYGVVGRVLLFFIILFQMRYIYCNNNKKSSVKYQGTAALSANVRDPSSLRDADEEDLFYFDGVHFARLRVRK